MTPGQLRKFPKVELHCHLDGCVRVRTIAEIGRKLGLALPEPLEAALVLPEQTQEPDLAGASSNRSSARPFELRGT